MEFKWLNACAMLKQDNKIEFMIPPKTDFSMEGSSKNENIPFYSFNAPFYYTESDGDFVLTVKISHDFKEIYDSASIMIMKNLACWAKCNFELTEYGTRAVTSVVTKGESDNATGTDLIADTIWLKACRSRNNFSFLYSLDNTNYYLIRNFTLPAPSIVKVGLMAQSPIGHGGRYTYENFTIEHRTVRNIRNGE